VTGACRHAGLAGCIAVRPFQSRSADEQKLISGERHRALRARHVGHKRVEDAAMRLCGPKPPRLIPFERFASASISASVWEAADALLGDLEARHLTKISKHARRSSGRELGCRHRRASAVVPSTGGLWARSLNAAVVDDDSSWVALLAARSMNSCSEKSISGSDRV